MHVRHVGSRGGGTFKLKHVEPRWGDAYGAPDLHDMLTVGEDAWVGRIYR